MVCQQNPCEHLLKKRVVSKFSVNHSRANRKVRARIRTTAPPRLDTCIHALSFLGTASLPAARFTCANRLRTALGFPSPRCRGVHRPRHESNGPEFAREETPHANALYLSSLCALLDGAPQSDDSSAVLHRLFFAWPARLPFQQRVGNPLAARNPKE